jgi:ABC-2 type transport system permease protein
MGSAVLRLQALVGKELAELRAAPGVLAGPVLMIVAAVAVPFGVAIGVPWWAGESLADAEDLVAMARETAAVAWRPGLGTEAAAQAFLLAQFVPLLVLVPVVGAMALVTTSIVDELKSRSLEPLLATPITTLELIAAKAGSAFVVAMALLAAGVLLFAVAAAVLAAPGVLAALLTPTAAALLLGMAPGAAATTLMLGVVTSSRAKDARTAQQFSVLVVLPLVGLFVSRIGDGVSPAAMLTVAVVAWAFTVLLAIVGVRVFDRERILTRWMQ